MRVTHNWLRQFLPGIGAAGELAELLTDIGIEVESACRAAPALAGVVAGRIHARHRVAGTKLHACLVDAGSQADIEVVCGAPNVRRGMRVALAMPGAQLPGGAVTTREIHGLTSHGMLCSAAELGLGTEHDVLYDLGLKARPGTPIDELLETADTVYDLAVTPDRGDWLSMLGVARELAAKLGLKAKRPRAPRLAATLPVHAAHIAAAARAACPKFTCLPLAGVNATVPTPASIRERLLRCGVRPVSVIVDLTNYVMLEIGQPLHAFDRGKLAGDITVRFAEHGERLTLIDGTEAALSPRFLAITDANGPQALGGVMGGLSSGVSDATTEVLLEAAHFVPAVVRGRTRDLNISSEAAFRFERGVDPNMCEIAIATCAKLIMRHCGGSCGTLTVAGATPAAAPDVTLRYARVEQLTGVAVTPAVTRRRLRALGFGTDHAGAGRGALRVRVPPWRFDIERAEDLVEEIIRLAGFANMPTTMPTLTGAFAPAPENLLDASGARDRLVADGYCEIITYAFVPPAWEHDFYANDAPITLANPLAAEQSAMRSGLLGGLLDRAIHNAHRQQTSLRLFELGRCFPPGATDQPQRLAALAWGPVAGDHWAQGRERRNHGFYDLAGTLARLLPGAQLRYAALRDHPALHPGRAARVTLDGQPIGVLGVLHPRLLGKHHYDLDPAPAVLELDFDTLARLPHQRQAQPLARLPLVRRDLSLLLDDAVPVGDLVKSATRNGCATCRIIEVLVFDHFTGAGIAAGKRSVGLRIVMQGSEENLVEAQISATMDAVATSLRTEHGATLRD